MARFTSVYSNIDRLRDLDTCRQAAERYRDDSVDGVLFRCINKEDASTLKAMMAELYPDVPCYFRWLEFGTG